MLAGEEDRRRAIRGLDRDCWAVIGRRAVLQSGLLGGAAVVLVMAAPAPGAEVSVPCPVAAPVARRAAAEESWLQRQFDASAGIRTWIAPIAS